MMQLKYRYKISGTIKKVNCRATSLYIRTKKFYLKFDAIHFFQNLGPSHGHRLAVPFLVLLFSTVAISAQVDGEINRLHQELTRAKTIDHKVDILDRIASEHHFVTRDSVLVYAQKLRQIGTEQAHEAAKNLANKHFGYYHLFNDGYKKAISFFEKSIAGCLKTDDKKKLVDLYNILSSCYYYQDDYPTTVHYQQKGIQVAYKLNDQEKICTYLENLGKIYATIKNHKLVLEVNSEMEELKYCQPGMSGHHVIALAQLNQRDTLGAFRTVKRASQLASKMKDTFELIDYYIMLGDIFFTVDSLDKSIHNYNVALDLQNKGFTTPKAILSEAIHKRTRAYHKQQNLDAALASAKLNYEIAEELQVNLYLYEATESLHSIYTDMGNKEEALKYGKLAISYNDSVIKENRSENLYIQLLAIEEQLAENRKTTQIKIDQKRNNNTIALLLGIFGLIGLLVYANHNKKLAHAKKMLESNVEQKQLLQKSIMATESSIATDLHDNLGNRFAGLVTTLDIVKERVIESNQTKKATILKHFSNLDQNLGSLIDTVKDLLWTARSENSTIQELAERVDTFSNEFNHKSTNKIRFDHFNDRSYLVPNTVNKHLLFSFREIIKNYNDYTVKGPLDLSLMTKDSILKISAKTNEDSDHGLGIPVYGGSLALISKYMATIGFDTNFIVENAHVQKIDIEGNLKSHEIL